MSNSISNPPLVSVVLATYNGSTYLKQAIDSILQQTFSNFELLIIDDCSTDGSTDPYYDFPDSRVRLIRNERNLGQTASLNIGLENAVGEFIARMDSDDICLPERLEKQLSVFASRSDCIIVGGQAILIDENGMATGTTDMPISQEAVRFFSFLQNPFIHSTVMFRRLEFLQQKLFYNTEYNVQDFELWSRVLVKNFGVNLSEPIVRYRVHNQSMTARNYEKNFLEVEKIIAMRFRKEDCLDAYDAEVIQDLLRYFFQARNVADEKNYSRLSLATKYYKIMRAVSRNKLLDSVLRKLVAKRILQSGLWPNGTDEIGGRILLGLKLISVWPLEFFQALFELVGNLIKAKYQDVQNGIF